MLSLDEKLIWIINIILSFISKRQREMREYYEKEWKIFLKCSKCWEFKEATRENFHKARENLFWCAWCCKLCVKDYSSNRYINNRDEILNKTREYHRSHKELGVEYYNKHKDRIKARVKKWKEDNQERLRKYWIDNRERLRNNRIFNEESQQKRKAREKEYRNSHKAEINARRREKNHEIWQGRIHLMTNRIIRRLWIRPTKCPICWVERRIEAHHPDYKKPYEIVFCCNVCHQRIHNWWFECPKPIDLHTLLL